MSPKDWFKVFICLFVLAVLVTLFFAVGLVERKQRATVAASNDAPAGPPTQVLWQDDRAILVRIEDTTGAFPCIVYVLQGTDFTTLNHQVSLSVATGRGCR
jgi:hypothetical protein